MSMLAAAGIHTVAFLHLWRRLLVLVLFLLLVHRLLYPFDEVTLFDTVMERYTIRRQILFQLKDSHRGGRSRTDIRRGGRGGERSRH